MVDDGRMPRPRIADGKRLWDVDELDSGFRELPREGGGSIADFLPRATGQRRTRKETLANPKSPPAAYSVKMLAEKLGCSRTHVYHLIRNGQIKTFRFGELIRIPAAELERLQSASFVEQPSPDKPNQEPTFSKPFKPWLHER
jgi:excisionase family DNA binding protein